MTTNKPEVVAWYTPPTRYTLPAVALNDRSQRGEPLIRLSDYEALQAELAELKQTPLFSAGYRFGRDANDAGHTVRLQKEKDALQAECDALRDKTRLTLGVGDGTGNLFVHGDYDSIKRVQELIFECEKLRKDADRYRWLRDPCSGAERVVTYGRGDYGRGLMAYTMLDEAIDAAMQGDHPYHHNQEEMNHE